MREIKFEYGFESVNGIVKKVYHLHEIPNMAQKCDVWNVLPIKYVRQFTGLKDKNGKDIYEGDIVRILYTDWPSKSDDSVSLEDYKKSISEIGKVIWSGSGWYLELWAKKYNEFMIASIHHGQHGEIEVIGNIYQNSELLKD